MSEVPAAIGDYQILHALGEGGMGRVYKAVHEPSGKIVAVKVLRTNLGEPRDSEAENEWRARFENEVAALKKLVWLSVVQIEASGYLPDGSPYLVMEYLDGGTLSQLLAELRRDGERLELDTLLHIGTQIAETMRRVHVQGIVHRDLKPGNIMLLKADDEPCGLRIKLFDFGIGKLASAESNYKTRAGAMLGTPVYMAPEAAQSADAATPKSDVYSFGIMLYEMIGGQVPFSGDDPLQVAMQHLNAEPPLLKTVNPATPEQLAQLVHRMLRKAADSRPTMEEVAILLARFLDPSAPAQNIPLESDAPTLMAPQGVLPAKVARPSDVTQQGQDLFVDQTRAAQLPSSQQKTMVVAPQKGTWQRLPLLLIGIGVLLVGGVHVFCAIAEWIGRRQVNRGDLEAARDTLERAKRLLHLPFVLIPRQVKIGIDKYSIHVNEQIRASDAVQRAEKLAGAGQLLAALELEQKFAQSVLPRDYDHFKENIVKRAQEEATQAIDKGDCAARDRILVPLIDRPGWKIPDALHRLKQQECRAPPPVEIPSDKDIARIVAPPDVVQPTVLPKPAVQPPATPQQVATTQAVVKKDASLLDLDARPSETSSRRPASAGPDFKVKDKPSSFPPSPIDRALAACLARDETIVSELYPTLDSIEQQQVRELCKQHDIVYREKTVKVLKPEEKDALLWNSAQELYKNNRYVGAIYLAYRIEKKTSEMWILIGQAGCQQPFLFYAQKAAGSLQYSEREQLKKFCTDLDFYIDIPELPAELNWEGELKEAHKQYAARHAKKALELANRLPKTGIVISRDVFIGWTACAVGDIEKARAIYPKLPEHYKPPMRDVCEHYDISVESK